MKKYFKLPILLMLFWVEVALANNTESYIVLERYSRKVLLAAGSEKKRPIANLSDMVTAKIALDWLKITKTSTTNLIIVPEHNFNTLKDNALGLEAGDRMSVRDALYSLILGQDRFSSYLLSHYIGGKLIERRNIKADPQIVFVNEMNRLANELLMNRTRFAISKDPSNSRDKNVSTASDLARLVHTLSTDTAYSFYAKQKYRYINVNKKSGSTIKIKVSNSNKMLNRGMKVVGSKVGYSSAAGHCASFLADRDFYIKKLPNGDEQVTPVQLILIVLGSVNIEKFANNVIPQGWHQYDLWRNSGYMVSPNRREFLRVSQHE